MDELIELKEWLKIDGEDEDLTLSSLLISSRMIIKQATGLTQSDVQNNEEALELYKLAQKIIVTNLYENRTGAEKENLGLISLYTQLEVYKLQLANEDGDVI
jgi:uncharacterized phage protein (predicted DNA packaging)